VKQLLLPGWQAAGQQQQQQQQRTLVMSSWQAPAADLLSKFRLVVAAGCQVRRSHQQTLLVMVSNSRQVAGPAALCRSTTAPRWWQCGQAVTAGHTSYTHAAAEYAGQLGVHLKVQPS